MSSEVVLFVDDDAEMRDAYAELLRLGGFSATSTASGAAAVQAAVRLAPDMIILHLWDGDPDGFLTLRSLRTDTRVRRARLVAMAGSSGETSARASGCDVFIEKPLAASNFLAALRALRHPNGVTNDERGAVPGGTARNKARTDATAQCEPALGCRAKNM
jgi:DNA-binding response OmpR family regulator